MAVARPNWRNRFEHLKQMLQQNLKTLKDRVEMTASLDALSQVSDWYSTNMDKEKSFSILIIGETGSGKSTLVNNLLGEQVAEVGYGVESETSTIKEYSSTIQGIPVTLLDTPGLQDSGNTETNDVDSRVLGEIKSIIEGKSISVIIFCFRITATRRCRQTIEDFKKYHEIGIPWNKAVVALTFTDRLRDDGPVEEHVQKWKDSIRNDILVKEVGLTPHIAHQIAFRPTTKRPDIPLPGNKNWFVPLWFTVLEVLDPKAMIDFMMIHNKKLKDSRRTVDMEESTGVYTLEFIQQRYEKTFKTRIAKLLVKAAEKLKRYLPAVGEQRTCEDGHGEGDVPAKPRVMTTECLEDSEFVNLD